MIHIFKDNNFQGENFNRCYSRKQVIDLIIHNKTRFILFLKTIWKRDTLAALKEIQLQMKSHQVKLNDFRKDLNQVI